MITIKNESEIELMRIAGRIVGLAHKLVSENVKPGMTTIELDRMVEKFIRDNDAIPSFKGVEGFNNSRFPCSICASVNEEIIHGIPGNRVLNEGDIISVDIGACYKGYHGDSANTYAVGQISSEAQKLIDVTRESFYEGLKFAREGYRISDISHAIQKYAESFGYSIVREFQGHGVGSELHEDPGIPNYGRPGHGPRLKKGMTIAVEPMINQGTHQIRILNNNWTVITVDKKLSAHYEHSILITDGEPELLTKI